MASDTPDQNLSQYFSVCNDFIHAARLRDGNVLIHCLAGMSRSVTVTVNFLLLLMYIRYAIILLCCSNAPFLSSNNDKKYKQVAYIMSVTQLNWKEALKVVRTGRSVANPNLGFQIQLQDYEQYKLADVKTEIIFYDLFPISYI